MIEAILQYMFANNRDGVYVHSAPLMLDILIQAEKEGKPFKLEFLTGGLVRIWTPEGYEKYVINRPIKQAVDTKSILNENTKQMMLAIEAGDVKRILELRKQIRELGN